MKKLFKKWTWAKMFGLAGVVFIVVGIVLKHVKVGGGIESAGWFLLVVAFFIWIAKELR